MTSRPRLRRYCAWLDRLTVQAAGVGAALDSRAGPGLVLISVASTPATTCTRAGAKGSMPHSRNN